MAITNVINGVTTAVAIGAATAFTITEPTTILADGLKVGENVVVWRLGPSGSYVPATNKEGSIVLSAVPNMAVLDAAGTYKMTKGVTEANVYAGYGY